MTSFLSRLSPIPTFPDYTGPYTVGTQDIEIPVTELSSSPPSPDPSITTVSFRIFYPCVPEKHTKPVYWLPQPPSQYFQAYLRFLNASHRLAAFLSFLPIFRTIFYTTIPAQKDAKIAHPPAGIEKWPVIMFSHGLGGSRNAYSHITGSVASHGMVVVALEHRDGSAPISYIHSMDKSPPRTVDYRSLPHKISPEVEECRNKQMKVRLWELGLVHDALLKMDEGLQMTNIAPDQLNNVTDKHQFNSLLDIHTPGKIAWAGHSFGAATVVQFVKSVFYPPPKNEKDHEAIYIPSADSAISNQITPSSPVILLDMWALPLHLSASTEWLWKKSLPAYSGTNGFPPLAIISEAFFKWKSNLDDIKTTITPPKGKFASTRPYLFYPSASAHLSQSDFGPLFPWLTKKVFKAEDPERTMRLNVRAILESLRYVGIKVADTSDKDMEITPSSDASPAKRLEAHQRSPLGQDYEILSADGNVKGWIAVPLDEQNGSANTNGHGIKASNPGEAIMEGEVMKG